MPSERWMVARAFVSREKCLACKRSLGPARVVWVLSAGRTVAGAACEARWTFVSVEDSTRPTMGRWLCAADEQPQRLVIRTLRLTLGQRLTLDRPKHRAMARIDNGDHDLQAARHVKHDPVKHATAAGHVHEVTCSEVLHNPSLSRFKHAPRDYVGITRSVAARTRNLAAATVD